MSEKKKAISNPTARTTQQPSAEFWSGQVRATIWIQKTETGDSRKYKQYSIRVRKVYCDKPTQACKSSDSSFPGELGERLLVAPEALRYTRLRGRIKGTEATDAGQA